MATPAAFDTFDVAKTRALVHLVSGGNSDSYAPEPNSRGERVPAYPTSDACGDVVETCVWYAWVCACLSVRCVCLRVCVRVCVHANFTANQR